MRIVMRTLAVLFGALLATLAAAIAAAFASVVMHATLSDFSAQSLNMLWNVFSTAVFIWIYLIFSIVFVPYLVAAILAEIFGLRSFLVYVIGAIVIAFLSPVLGGMLLPWFGGMPIFSTDLIAASIAAGLAAGIVYWLIAGRRAGSWRHA